jgi:chorismate lyase
VTHINTFNIDQLALPFAKGCDNHWFSATDRPCQDLSPVLSSWLFDRGSLTARLKQHCNDFTVIVLNSGRGTISALERLLFPDTKMPLNCREVLLVCDGIPQVYARSLIPDITLESNEMGLKQLGNNSLGQILFQAPHAHRGEIEATSFDKKSTIARLANQLDLPMSHDLWGRRSLFNLQQYPLLVSEVFLPGSFAYHEITS